MRRVILVVVLLAACGSGDPIENAGSCSELRTAWDQALSDPDLTGQDIEEVMSRGYDRVEALMVDAIDNDNPIQTEACMALAVDMAALGGTIDPTFETCPDGSMAAVGEC